MDKVLDISPSHQIRRLPIRIFMLSLRIFYAFFIPERSYSLVRDMNQDVTCPEFNKTQRDWANRALRVALQKNLVSFPAQAPVFNRLPRADIHWKLAVLYFVRGWSMRDIATRYRLGRARVGQIITAWRINAVDQGYVQTIPPEAGSSKAT